MDTRVTQDRYEVANALELDRLKVKKEIEELMREYAKISGCKELGNRPHKVGKAPNDWKNLRK